MGVTTVKDVTQAPGEGWIRVSDLRPLLAAMPALRDGDFRVRLPAEHEGIAADLARAFNQIADRNQHFTEELCRVTREVTRHGRLDERLSASPGQGSWTSCVESANILIEALVVPAANATRVLDAVADGEFDGVPAGDPPAARHSRKERRDLRKRRGLPAPVRCDDRSHQGLVLHA